MCIRALKLYNFRNLVDQNLSFSEGTNFIVGKNAQGKTNLIEAIHLLSATRSFRTSIWREMIRWGETSASVFGEIESAQLEAAAYQLGLTLSPEGREGYLNGQRTALLTGFYGKLSTITFSPTDIALVTGGPQVRRRFVDRHLADFDPRFIREMLTYTHALKNKNELLKDGIEDDMLLDPWDKVMAESAYQIEKGRLLFLERLAHKAGAILKNFGESDGKLSIQLSTGLKPHDLASPDAVYGAIKAVRRKEQIYKTSLIGPHRDEILFTLGGKAARAFASQGQARSLTLALKLAVIELLEEEKEKSPVLLLDDVDAELDDERAQTLFAFALQPVRQVFITGISLREDLLKQAHNLQIMKVEDGVIKAHPDPSFGV